MANILDRYGIKEVADVTFYALDDNGNPTYPVLYLDTLKVSTIEQTAESADATGGKGNAKLITWDYGKDITVTLEDALFSAKSMAIMFGNGKADATASGVRKTLVLTATKPSEGVDSAATSAIVTSLADFSLVGWEKTWKGGKGREFNIPSSFSIYAADATESTTTVKYNERYFLTFSMTPSKSSVIEISANEFPGTYYVTGDTYARSEDDGIDEFFQFIIHKAKITSENTITLEAEGDPSVFNMNLTVLRPRDGVMMELVKYDLTDKT